MSDKILSTIHALLYILKKLEGKSDFHKIFKLLYFADREHLVKYGVQISGDRYIAMDKGPVPSVAFDGLKSLRKASAKYDINSPYAQFFKVPSWFIVEAVIDPDMEELSESEIECLDNSVSEHGAKSFPELTRDSHDAAYKSTHKDGHMRIRKIASAGSATDEMIKYIDQEQILAETTFY